ncbi:hypothetical protein K435DRAFT_802405 [Dendrothele bispora CBS 962.96]|uniref:DUF6532 domain-containing protein n=1 Tax=Dendrothele bispora (strain CBS 962.96) TaxID=1314807 RepID=A0A4S8LL29_DENBC|nr:hypothetical protein K435DRAFT_802405 [Dendrothele bispora CBS 962.96]
MSEGTSSSCHHRHAWVGVIKGVELREVLGLLYKKPKMRAYVGLKIRTKFSESSADRLKRGDSKRYIDPLIKYVSQHITLERTSHKKDFSTIVLQALGVTNSYEGTEKAGDGTYNYDQLFGTDIVYKYLNAAFFGNTQYAKAYKRSKKADLFVSSIPEWPLEYEIPKPMLAMAGCVIRAILVDVGKNKQESFPPEGFIRKKPLGHGCTSDSQDVPLVILKDPGSPGQPQQPWLLHDGLRAVS